MSERMVRPVAQAMQAMRAEVIAREQQRRATVFRHSVRKAVAEVELRRMPALLRRRVPSPPPDGDEQPNGGPRCTDLGMVRLHPVLIVAARNYAFAFLLIRWPRREDCNRPLRRGNRGGRDDVRRDAEKLRP